MRFIPNQSNDPKLDAVLSRLCTQLGDLWTMQAVKLPYFVDLVSLHVRGVRVTNSQHKAWKLGVVTARAWGLITKEKGGRYFEVYGDPITDGIRLRVKVSPPDVLDDMEKRIVDFVAAEFGCIRPDTLGKLTKELNPDVPNWGDKDLVQLTDDAYQRLPIWLGENEADVQDAVKVLERIDSEPIVSGEEADCLLAEWAK